MRTDEMGTPVGEKSASHTVESDRIDIRSQPPTEYEKQMLEIERQKLDVERLRLQSEVMRSEVWMALQANCFKFLSFVFFMSLVVYISGHLK